MSNTIQIKRGSSIPTTSDLANYELGFKTDDNTLYIRNGSNIISIGRELIPLIKGTGQGSIIQEIYDGSVANIVTGKNSIAFGKGNTISSNYSQTLGGAGMYIGGTISNIGLCGSTNNLTLTGDANAIQYTTTLTPNTRPINGIIGKHILKRSNVEDCAVITNAEVVNGYIVLTLDKTLSSAALSDDTHYAIGGATVQSGSSNIALYWGNIISGNYNFVAGAGGHSSSEGTANFSYGSYNVNSNKNFVTMFGHRLLNTNTGTTFIIGQYNIPDTAETPHSFLIGQGTSVTDRQNIFSIDKLGNIDLVNNITATGIISAASFEGSISASNITDTLAIAQGGTGQTSIANIQAGKDGNGNTISSTYLKLSGGTMTGILTMKASQYTDDYTGALNMNNSNIYGVNAIYTSDDAGSATEGFNFYRTATTVDTIHAHSGVLYFTPNRTLGTSGTSYKVYHAGNLTYGTSDPSGGANGDIYIKYVN